MSCDGKKVAIIKDFDGSVLGAPGAVIPDVAFAWDDPKQKPRGIGDYRIPKTLLSRNDGRRIPVNELIDHRGIIGSDECTFNEDGTRLIVTKAMFQTTACWW